MTVSVNIKCEYSPYNHSTHANTTFGDYSPQQSTLKKSPYNLHVEKSESMLHVQIRVLNLDTDGYKKPAVLLRFILRTSVYATLKMPQLNEENRNRAIGRLEAGESQTSKREAEHDFPSLAALHAAQLDQRSS